MNRKNLVPILSALLIAQLLLVGFLQWRSDKLQPVASTEKLVNVDKDQVQWLRIADRDGKQIKLAKTAAGWIIPDKYNFPVDKNKLAGVLDEVLEFKQGYAVGKSETSAKQFRVTKADFERHLELGAAGDKVLANILFGSSPAFKQVHVRVDGGPTFLTDYTVYNLALEPKDWLDFSSLRIDEKAIKKVIVNDVVIESAKRADGSGTEFVVAAATAEESFDPERIKDLVDKAAAPIFNDVLGKSDAADFAKLPKVIEWTVETSTAPVSYKITGPLPTSKDAFALSVSGKDYIYQVTAKEKDAIKGFTRESLKAAAVAAQDQEVAK